MTKNKEPKNEPEIEEPILIKDLETYQEFFSAHKLNPLEQVMAIKLLTNGYEFYAQYKIDISEKWIIQGKKYFILDFLLPNNRIVIETDGKIHDNERNYKYDRNRTNALVSMGYRVFRFDWDDVMDKNEKFDIMDFIYELELNDDFSEHRLWEKFKNKNV